MEKVAKIFVLIVGLALLVPLILFLLSKDKIINMIESKVGEVVITDLKVNQDVATMNIKSNISNKIIPAFVDSIKYTMVLYGDNIASGTKNFTNKNKESRSRELSVPVSMKYKSIAEKIKKHENDSAQLGVKMTAYYRLPIVGTNTVNINRNIKVRIPIIPEVKIKDLNVKKLGVNKVDMVVKLEVENLNKIEFEIKDFKYDLKIKDYVETSGTASKPIRIEKYGKSEVEIPISMDLNNQGKAIADLIKGDRDWEYTMSSRMVMDPQNSNMPTIPMEMQSKGKVDILELAKLKNAEEDKDKKSKDKKS